MARTAEGARLTQQQRREQLALRAGLVRDVTAAWAAVDVLDLSGTVGAFAAAGAALVRSAYRESSDTAAGYVAAFAVAEGEDAMPRPDTPDPPPDDVTAGALRGSALSGIIGARRAGFSPSAAARNGLVKANGKATKLTLDGGRLTVTRSIGQQRQQGRPVSWMRITSGDPCWWCARLASRGADYRSEESGGFQAHDHCACVAEPSYTGSDMTDEAAQHRDLWNSVRNPDNHNLSRDNFRRAYEGRA